MVSTTVRVEGMTCEHCTRSVREEVSAIDGVSDVVVELADGTVVVTSVAPVESAALREAIAEAGYRLVES